MPDLAWAAAAFDKYGLPGLFAIAMISGIRLVNTLIERKRQNGNGHETPRRRWDDRKDKDEPGDRLTLKDIRDSLHDNNNNFNKTINALSQDMGEMRGEMQTEFRGVKERLTRLESKK